MSKVGGALPAWYWPAGVPRRVAVPQQPLDRLLKQRLARTPDQPAIISDSTTLTCGQLLERAQAIAGGIQASDVLPGTIAVAESGRVDELLLLLGALMAGRQVLLVDPSDPADAVVAQLSEAKAAVVVTVSGAGEAPGRAGIRIIRNGELAGAFREPPPKRAADPAVMLPSHRGVVVHSHFSLSAMWASLVAFIPRLRELALLCAQPIGSWEALSGILGAILSGAPIVFATVDELKAGTAPPAADRGYTILARRAADAMLGEDWAPPFLTGLQYVFVSTGQFSVHWRRRLERLLGRAIFPLWGLPELGPVVAPHPTWYPVHGHGLPLVNVSLVPIDPSSGRVSIVPWEMLERAEVGVEALSAMVGYTEAPRTAAVRVGKVIRTGQIAEMDHVGVVTLHGAPAGEQG